jgi:acetyltransferase-like isoleucine patch superfamily enzyme
MAMISRARRLRPRSRPEPVHPHWISPEVTIGEHTYGTPIVKAMTGHRGRVTIGRYCSIAEEATFVTASEHRTEWVTTFPIRAMLDLPGAFEDGHPTDKGPITVGHDVWLGAGCMILSGVTIGNGAVVAARAVVAKDVRPYAIAVGNPAREVRRRFTDEQIDGLMEIAWWDWPTEKVVAEVAGLCSDDVDSFISRHAHERVGTTSNAPDGRR